MTLLGVISDTHGLLRTEALDAFSGLSMSLKLLLVRLPGKDAYVFGPIER